MSDKNMKNKNQKSVRKSKKSSHSTLKHDSPIIVSNQNETTQLNNNNNGKKSQPYMSINNTGRLSVPTISPPPGFKKIERSNSFFLTRKLSALVNTITRSRENLSTKICSVPDEDENTGNGSGGDGAVPYKFTRSRSMILLRRPNRRSVVEPQLEKLSEEMERGSSSGNTSGGVTGGEGIENGVINDNSGVNSGNMNVAHSNNNKTLTHSSSLPCQTNLDFIAQDPPQERRKKSSTSSSSSTLITTLKRTFSNSGDKKKSTNTRWSASLVSLQEIDNMISYEDLSFIDYDKFNNYERFLEQSLSQQDISHITPTPPPPSVSATTEMLSVQENVVKRRKRNENTERNGSNQVTNMHRTRSSSIFDSNFEHNLDKKKNVYRQSLDDQKLQHINDIQRNSFRWSSSFEPLIRVDSVPVDNSIGKIVRNDSFRWKSCEAVISGSEQQNQQQQKELFDNTEQQKNSVNIEDDNYLMVSTIEQKY